MDKSEPQQPAEGGLMSCPGGRVHPQRLHDDFKRCSTCKSWLENYSDYTTGAVGTCQPSGENKKEYEYCASWEESEWPYSIETWNKVCEAQLAHDKATMGDLWLATLKKVVGQEISMERACEVLGVNFYDAHSMLMMLQSYTTLEDMTKTMVKLPSEGRAIEIVKRLDSLLPTVKHEIIAQELLKLLREEKP